MKRFLVSILTVLMIISSLSPKSVNAVSNQLLGSGTKDNPWLISDAEDFVNMSSLIASDASYADDYYKMTNDVDFTGVTMTKIGSSNHFS